MTSMHQLLLATMVLFPLGGAMLNGLAGRKESRRFVVSVAIGAVVLSFISAVIAFGALVTQRSQGGDPEIVLKMFQWFSITLQDDVQVPIRAAFVMDALSGVMCLVITGIGLLIHIYAAGYMSEEPSYARFFAYLNLFMASMLILVLGSNLPLMFVGWEGVGLCSYLLIGFWWTNTDYAKAGRKAFIANRIGDFGVIIGTLILVTVAHSFEFKDINASASSLAAYSVMGGLTLATVACLFLFLGCTGKSAQLPLFVWLPDAMAGPTPVSALIHAATMVTAGVYLTCRLSPLFLSAPHAMAVIAVIGALTAFIGATIALVQNQLKKVLAYSTVSQLGFMFAAVGSGAFMAGFFHVFTHAFFKACLFLGAGSVMHAVHAHGDADVRELGGLKKYLPQTHWTFLVSCLAIAGFPLLSGFFSKDEILLGALLSTRYFEFAPWVGAFVFVLLLCTAAMTAFYMMRLYFLTFAGEYRGHAHPHESSPSMTVPLAILATGAALAGYVGLPHAWHLPNLWTAWLEPAVAKNFEPEHGEVIGLAVHSVPNVVMALGTLAGLFGIGLAWSVYVKGQGRLGAHMAQALPKLHAFLMDKWRIDEFYDFILLSPMRTIANVSSFFDKVVVDGVLTRLSAAFVRLFGFLLTRIQTGSVSTYATMMGAGIFGLALWMLYPHPQFSVASTGARVQFDALPSFGEKLEWDFNSDGAIEPTPAAKGNIVTVHYVYDLDKDVKAYEVQLVQNGEIIAEQKLSRGQRYVIDKKLSLASQDVSVKWDVAGMSWQVQGQKPTVLPKGEHGVLDMNWASLVVRFVPVVKATLHVTNVLGNKAERTIDVPIVFNEKPTLAKANAL